MVRPVPTCQRWAGWRSSSASALERLELDVDAGAIAEQPEGVQAVVVARRTPAPCRRSARRARSALAPRRCRRRGQCSGPSTATQCPSSAKARVAGSPIRRAISTASSARRTRRSRERIVAQRAREPGEQPDPLAAVLLADRRQRALQQRDEAPGRCCARAHANLPPYASAARASWSEPARLLGERGRPPERLLRLGPAPGAAQHLAEREQQLAGRCASPSPSPRAREARSCSGGPPPRSRAATRPGRRRARRTRSPSPPRRSRPRGSGGRARRGAARGCAA